MTCANCICNTCVQTRKRIALAAIKKQEMNARAKAKQDEKDRVRKITVREAYFKGKQFRTGFQSVLFNSTAARHLSVRAANILWHNQIRTVRDLLDTSVWKLLRMKNMGPTTFAEMVKFMEGEIVS